MALRRRLKMSLADIGVPFGAPLFSCLSKARAKNGEPEGPFLSLLQIAPIRSRGAVIGGRDDIHAEMSFSLHRVVG
jgi:hypothetical protein